MPGADTACRKKCLDTRLDKDRRELHTDQKEKSRGDAVVVLQAERLMQMAEHCSLLDQATKWLMKCSQMVNSVSFP